MDASKKPASAKKTKRKPSAKSLTAAKQIIEQKVKSYPGNKHTPGMVHEDAVIYGKNKPKQGTASSNKAIEKKLKALNDLIGIAPGLWYKDGQDAQDYVNRLRDNDRF